MTDKTEKSPEDPGQAAIHAFIQKHLYQEGDEIVFRTHDTAHVLVILEGESREGREDYEFWTRVFQTALTQFLKEQDPSRSLITEAIKKRISEFEATKEAHIKDLRALDERRQEIYNKIYKVEGYREEFQALLDMGKEGAK